VAKANMKILFVTLVAVDSLEERSIYADVLRAFHRQGHTVVVVSPIERRNSNQSYCKSGDRFRIIRFSTLNIQKANLIEKTIGTFSVDILAQKAIRRFANDLQFDLAIFTTPPVTITSTIAWVKKHHQAFVYLLLKDIFPQNAVDIGMLKQGGFLHRYFRKKESKVYALADQIGCMSPANKAYILAHNPEIPEQKVEVCPNSVEPIAYFAEPQFVKNKRIEYLIPEQARVFLYGGNLGKPQGIDFLIKCLEALGDRTDAFFLIIGSGTEFQKLDTWFKKHTPKNAKLLSQLAKADYDQIVGLADVGLIFLDQRFTIPNFPSRLLSYLEWKKPVWAIVDRATDLGSIAEEYGFGKMSLAGDISDFSKSLEFFLKIEAKTIDQMGNAGYSYLIENCHIDQTTAIIKRSMSA
jgi:glycosyltransferase involved in cell wall biosynthesis